MSFPVNWWEAFWGFVWVLDVFGELLITLHPHEIVCTLVHACWGSGLFTRSQVWIGWRLSFYWWQDRQLWSLLLVRIGPVSWSFVARSVHSDYRSCTLQRSAKSLFLVWPWRRRTDQPGHELGQFSIDALLVAVLGRHFAASLRMEGGWGRSGRVGEVELWLALEALLYYVGTKHLHFACFGVHTHRSTLTRHHVLWI